MTDMNACDCGKQPYAMRIGRQLPWWWVQCYCGQRTENHISRKQAVEAWNRGERKPTKENSRHAAGG
jgi:hypothetical protein